MKGLLLGIAPFLLIALGVFLPREWYDLLPLNSEMPPPGIRGVTLLQVSFVVEGLLLAYLVRRDWKWTPLEQSQRINFRSLPVQQDKARSGAVVLLAAIILFGLGLRFYGLNSDLWIDEISPLRMYGKLNMFEVMGTYLGSNNHLLNTLLVNWSVSTFGQHEWSIRLPAVLFGIATIPAFYWVARMALPRFASLAAALLVAVSYHHIFFSQNSRGYAAYMFFAVLSSGLLCRALESGRLMTFALYALAATLGFAALMNTAFVLGAHFIVCATAAVLVWRRGISPAPLIKLLAVVFSVIGLLAFQTYALILPKVYVYMQNVYTQPAAGYSMLSGEFLREVWRGLSIASPVGWVATIPLLITGVVLGCLGMYRLFRRHWGLTAALILPGVITAGFVLLAGLAATPRLFLLMLFPAILVGVTLLHDFIHMIIKKVGASPRWTPILVTAPLLVIAAVSLFPLNYYYTTPKQPFRASLQYLSTIRKAEDVIIPVQLVEEGYRFYGPGFGLDESNSFYVRSQGDFDAVLATHGREHIFVVTTLLRNLRLTEPGLNTAIERDWQILKTFPATIGDGEVSVWKPK